MCVFGGAGSNSRVDAQHHDVFPQVPGAHHLDNAGPLGGFVQLLLQFWKETANEGVMREWPLGGL